MKGILACFIKSSFQVYRKCIKWSLTNDMFVLKILKVIQITVTCWLVNLQTIRIPRIAKPKWQPETLQWQLPTDKQSSRKHPIYWGEVRGAASWKDKIRKHCRRKINQNLTLVNTFSSFWTLAHVHTDVTTFPLGWDWI